MYLLENMFELPLLEWLCSLNTLKAKHL